MITSFYVYQSLNNVQVHKFDQEADETRNWLEEKEAALLVANEEDITHADSRGIQARYAIVTRQGQ